VSAGDAPTLAAFGSLACRRIGAAALARRGLGPLAQPIPRLEPPGASASALGCAPAAQPPPRYEQVF